MPNVNVLNAKGDKVRDFAFADNFLPEAPNTHLMHLHVVRQLRNKRAGTASTLNRDEVAGGGKKPWKQKGTGRARAGSIRSPLWKGGGVIFGPKPRKFSMTLNVKARRVALRSALLAQLPQTVAVESFGLDKPSTKALSNVLTKGLKATGKVLLIVKEHDNNVSLSARNLKNVNLILANNLSVKALLNADHVVATEDALRQIQEVFKA
jgi:large subunit ribosomal protein L4